MKYLALLSIALFLFSCNKEKRYSSKLMKGEFWEVNDVKVEGNSLGVYGAWFISSDVDIYETVPKALWKNGTEDAQFEWQFQDKGKTFQLNYVQLCEECEGSSLDNLDYTVYELTGNYDVERHSATKMEFTSTNTLGHSGKKVVISITRW